MLPIHINLCDAAVADAHSETLRLLCVMGQDIKRGYRSVLSSLLTEKDKTVFSNEDNKAEKAVRVLNFVVFEFENGTFNMPDDKKASLFDFFISRIKHGNF